MKRMNPFFYLVLSVVLFSVVVSSCSGSPESVAVVNEPADQLDAAVREISDYLNKQLPKGNKLMILNVQSDHPALSEYIIDELIANTVNDRVFTVVDRNQLNTIRAELNFQMSGEVDDQTAQSLGRMAGAQIIISGAVSKLGDLYRLRIRALSVQSAQIEGQFNRNIPEGDTILALVNSKATGYGDGIAPRTAESVVAVVPVEKTEPQKGMVYNRNGHSYKIVNQSMTWNDANIEAERQGGYLATIIDSGEQEFIEDLIARNGNKNFYWLGGYLSGNRWIWVDNAYFNYVNWGTWSTG